MESFLFSCFVFLAAACFMVPVSKWTGLGSVIGYLLAGILIGPYVLGLITDAETILHFAEFGVVMMLFLIGLELKPKDFFSMRGQLVGFGATQLILSSLAIFAVALAFGRMWGEAALIGLALGLSSTAIAIQIMQERGIMQTRTGTSGFSVLLFQDIAVIPIIALIPVFAAYSGLDAPVIDGYGDDHGGGFHAPTGWLYAVAVIGAFAGMILGGRIVLRPLFRFVARANVREIFTAMALLLVVGAALLMQWLGLSAALGAFIAGVVLADSPYRHQLERDIEPFKALLLGLFFISVGMSINFTTLLSNPALIAALVIGLVAIKFIILYAIGRFHKLDTVSTLLFAALLCQGGEFALVLFQYGLAAGAIAPDLAGQLNAVVALSMATTPLLLLLLDKVILPKITRPDAAQRPDLPEGMEPHVLVLGFGRVGQMAARVLGAQGYKLTIIDHDPDHIEFIRQFGFTVYYGEAEDMDLLHTAGAGQAKLIIVATDDRDEVTHIVREIKQRYPQAKIVARARNRQHLFDLRALGVDKVERETFRGGLAMGEYALELLGLPQSEAHQVMQIFRKHDLATVEAQIAHREDMEKLKEIGQAAKVNLENTLAADREIREKMRREREKLAAQSGENTD